MMEYDMTSLQSLKDWVKTREGATAPKKIHEDDRAHAYAHDIVALIKSGEVLARDVSVLIESVKEYGFNISLGEKGEVSTIFKPEDN